MTGRATVMGPGAYNIINQIPKVRGNREVPKLVIELRSAFGFFFFREGKKYGP